MIEFSDMCADMVYPLFNAKCAENAMDLANVNKDKVEDCMKEIIEKQNGTAVTSDITKFHKSHVYRVPQILLNGVKYRVKL